MLDTINKFPETAFVAPTKVSGAADFEFPQLSEKANFKLGLEPLYKLNAMGMAEKVNPIRGLPAYALVNKQTGQAIHSCTDQYRPVENWEGHKAVEEALRDALPIQYLQDMYLVENIENGGRYNELKYGLKDYALQIFGDEWRSYISPVLSLKMAANSVCIVAKGECSTTGNYLSLGNRAAASSQHVQSFTTDFIIDHIKQVVTDFPKYVKKFQEFLNAEITDAQVDTVISLSRFSSTMQNEIKAQYYEVEAPEMGYNRLALFNAFCTWGSKPIDNFRVKNADGADNVAETLATRQRKVSLVASSPFFFGKEGV